MAGLNELYPFAPAAKVQAAALMLIGPYIMVIAETGRIETFPERAFSSGDLTLLGPMMKEFIAGGIRGMLDPRARRSAGGRRGRGRRRRLITGLRKIFAI